MVPFFLIINVIAEFMYKIQGKGKCLSSVSCGMEIFGLKINISRGNVCFMLRFNEVGAASEWTKRI